MSRQFSLAECNHGMRTLATQIQNTKSNTDSLQNVINDFNNVDGFSGETEKQVKAFMNEVVKGSIESVSLLIDNLGTKYIDLEQRFQSIEGLDVDGVGSYYPSFLNNVIIYEDKLICTQNDTTSQGNKIRKKIEEINLEIGKAINLGVSLKKCDSSKIDEAEKKIKENIGQFKDTFISVADISTEAEQIDPFLNAVRKYIAYLGSTEPYSYQSGQIANESFYRAYFSKAVEIMKAKSYDYYAPKSPINMTVIEKYAIAEKLAEDTGKARNGDIEAKTRLENFFRDVAIGVYHKGEVPMDGNDYVAKRFSEYAVILDSVSRAKFATIEVILKNLSIEKRSGLYSDDIQSQINSLKDYNLASSIFSSMASVPKSLNSQTDHYILSPFNLSSGFIFGGTSIGQSEDFMDKPFKLNFSKDEYGSTVVDIEVRCKESIATISDKGTPSGFQITDATKNTKIVQGNSGSVTHIELGQYFEETYKEAQENLKSANDALVFSVASELIGKFGDVGTAFGTLNTATGLQGQIQAVYEAQKNLRQVGITKEKFKELTTAGLLDNECVVTAASNGSVQIIPTMEMYNIITALNKHNKSNYTFSDLSNVEKLEQVAKEYNKLVEEYNVKLSEENKKNLGTEGLVKKNIKEYGNPYGNPNTNDKNGQKAREYLGGIR